MPLPEITLDPTEYGTVTWTGLISRIDSVVDPDDLPDKSPVTGSIIFKPSAGALKFLGASPVFTMFLIDRTVNIVDAQVDEQGRKYIKLESNSAHSTPEAFTWTAVFNLEYEGKIIRVPDAKFSLQPGQVLDLSTVISSAEVTYYTPMQLSAAVAAREGAEAARDETVTIKDEVVEVADTVDAKIGAIPITALPEAVSDARYSPRIPTYQAQLLGQAMKKLRLGQAVKIVCRGDSTTYGHDTVSSDRVPAPDVTLPDGTKPTFTRSPVPFPQAMQNFLNQTYGEIVTVENQGHSGDWVQRGMTRWLNNVNADITVISYGINDALSTGVPVEIRGNIASYIEATERMILRDLAWGSAVVLMAPIRQRGPVGSPDVDAYRNALRGLADSYGIPLIETEEFLITAPWDCWSDGNHLNTKGNGIMGARLAALFIGEGPLKKNIVEPGSKLLGRPTLDNVVLRGAIQTTSTGFKTPRDESAMQAGLAVGFQGGGTTALDGVATWSFYTESPDVVLIPWSYINADYAGETGAQISYELDFAVEQGQNYNGEVVSPGVSGNGTLSPSWKIHGPFATGQVSSYMSDPVTNPLAIRVSTPGWHTIRAIFHRTVTQAVAVTHMIEAMDWRTYQEIRKPIDFTPVTNSLQAVNVPVPSYYNESADITVTKIGWPALLQALSVKSWGVSYYSAPIVKLTLRTYGVGVIEYAFLCTQRPDQAGADIAQRSVDSYAASEGSSAIPFLKKLGPGFSTIAGGAAPEVSTSAREIAYLSYEAATQSLVFTWRTQNSGDSTAKYLRKNFLMTFSLL
ncbi:tail protein [Gordonia phage Demosthenes]|uniref:Minor tail protein n=1 Tax=Gordonia phage Demosthenes TaxID=1838067 RepID=A0A160DDZ7_9CAUD|nr:tail protein [Gordonia phage Demosthenes]ANA85982.1 minor tail protein [Gordonia phage Demosthenes]